jgi:hypothetical protein
MDLGRIESKAIGVKKALRKTGSMYPCEDIYPGVT